MKKKLLLLPIFAAVASACVVYISLNYDALTFFLLGKNLVDRDADFSIRFPRHYRMSVQSVGSTGENVIQKVVYTQDFPGVHNCMSVMDYPSSLLKKYGPIQLMMHHVNELASEMPDFGRKTYYGYRNDISGIEFHLSHRPEIQGYCFHHGNRLYIVYTRIDDYGCAESHRANSRSFRCSFRILSGPNWEQPGYDDIDSSTGHEKYFRKSSILYKNGGGDDSEAIKKIGSQYSVGSKIE